MAKNYSKAKQHPEVELLLFETSLLLLDCMAISYWEKNITSHSKKCEGKTSISVLITRLYMIHCGGNENIKKSKISHTLDMNRPDLDIDINMSR